MKCDFEADGNTHVICAVYMTWAALGMDEALGKRYLTETSDVFAWFTQSLASCPYGYLMPSISELSGNPEVSYPVYGIYATYGVMTAFRLFAKMAKRCGMTQIQAQYTAEANKIKAALLEKLVSRGSPPHVLTPAGAWINGLDGRDGRYYEIAEFCRHGIVAHHWTRQLPFVQAYDGWLDHIDDENLANVHQTTYAHIQAHMAEGYYFRKYGFVSATCWSGIGGRHDDTMAGYGQNYFTQSALMADDVNTYTLCMKGIARLVYDGDVAVPMTYEMNPWLMHECFNYDHYEQGYDHTFGVKGDDTKDIYDNPGDEASLVQCAETLKTIALVVGISADDGILYIKPRLPWTWDGMEVFDYPVIDGDSVVRRIHVKVEHERWQKTTRIRIDNILGFSKTIVRFGPYPNVMAFVPDGYSVEQTKGASWLRREFEQSASLDWAVDVRLK